MFIARPYSSLENLNYPLFCDANRVVIAGLYKLNGYSSVRHFVSFDKKIKRPLNTSGNNMICPLLAKVAVNNSISSDITVGV
jgi:hypothetical protein